MLAAVVENLDQRAAAKTYGLGGDDLTPGMSWSFRSLRDEWNR
jgi:putative transposase